ncbi:HAMP domain-containing sensor histidine kinase [Pseudoalteromonas ruthenica]|uniref:HAMP domain-containing sensor histidine kinase n=1 Tax=Pseudoalteromonas ruthenica TaxID=151081 RepID=UPI00241CD3BE|nr:ATP-binding protein [Pseudoalteromonas ruthenica]|tara:strand:+ start:54923 stop:56191 length:1269 start_codon:yes stop_codon:yes gene_type:complete
MKKLYLSLLCTALISVVLLSWLIDSFASGPTQQDDFTQQRKVLAGMVSYLSEYEAKNQQQGLDALNQHFKLDIGLENNATLALPPSLITQLYSNSGLVLADNQGLYLVRAADSLHGKHLTMRLPKPKAADHDLLLTVLFYTGVSLCMWLPLIPLTRRISVLSNVTQQFADGHLEKRISASRWSYTTQLERRFNAMAEQINALLDENKLMASSLSHDIRTPIACLRFGLDAAIESDEKGAQQRYLQRMEKDLDTMESMLNSYLSYAALQQQTQQLTYSQTSASLYLHDICEQLQAQAKANGQHIEVRCSNALKINADLHWLARALINILGNALRYAHQSVTVCANIDGHFLAITIEDDGPGIPQAERAAILKPFYQSAKHRSAQGYGLGLAICQKVMVWHHGYLEVSESNSLGGAKFTLKLPL